MVEPMDAFEEELREQLQTRMPPAGFADRVLARASERGDRRRTWLPVWRWALAALLVGAVVVGGLEHDRQQRREGEQARAQVLLALRITGTTLHHVQQKVAASSGGATDEDAQP